MADFDGDDDDFGDLYADVEAQASSAINSALCSTRLDAVEPDEGDKVSAEAPSAGLGLREDGELGRRELDWEGSGDNDVNVVDDGSDSEDDFNIVLNDDDCEFRGGAREGGVGFNVDEDQKGDDDFAGLSEGNDSSKKCTQEDQLAEGSEPNHNIQVSNDRRNGVKVNSNQHYKYIRNHQPLFPSNIAPNGSTGMIAFPSMSTKCDWGDNGYNHQQGSNSGQVSRAYAKANTAVAQSGYAFWLPRYRTILDINIDTFEEKPWNYPGVDISDFFNFGFNEDSWKLYCNSLEHHRQQSSMRTWIPSYDSFKLNQVYGAGSMHEKVFQKAWVSASKSSGGQGRRSELPKGRSIQVEESSSERLPSMDMRRPKSCYSDVVIEINVQDSAEESSGLSNKELDHTTNSKEQEKPEYRDLDVDSDEQIHCCESASGDVRSIECGEGNLTRLDRCTTTAPTLVSLDSDNHGNDRVSDVDIHNHAKVNVCTSTGIVDTMEIEKNTDDDVCADTCDAYPFLSEAALSLEDQSLSSPALSSIGSDSEVSKGCINDNSGNTDNLLKGLPSDSDTKLWESVASDYTGLKRNEAKNNLGDCEDYYFRNEKPIRQERNNPSGRLSNVAELKVRTANGDVSIVSDTEAFCDRGNKLFDCHRQKEGLHKFTYYNNQDFSSYRDTERYPRKIGHRSFRDKMVPYHKKVWGEFSHEQRNARQDAKDIENYGLHGGRGFSSGDMSPATYAKKRNFTWRRKTDKEQFQEKAAGHGGQPHDYRNENYFVRRRYERHLQSSGRGLQNFGGRDRHRIIPPLDLGRSLPTEYGDEHWGLSDHQSLFSHSYEESHMTAGRCYQNRQQKHVVYDSRSSERSGRCRKQICAEEGREGDWYMRCNDSHPDESLHLGRGRYNCHSKALHWSGDNIISRQQDSELYEEGAMFLYEKKSGNRMIHTQSGTLCDKMYIDDAQLEHNRYGKTGEGNNANCFSRSFNTRCKDKHQQTGQMCGDSIDLVVGEGKPARRYSNGRSLAHNKEWNRQTNPKDSGHRVVGISNPSKEKWLDKLGVTEQNQDMDIEEGQIVTEEPINSSEEENHVAESEGQIDNQRVLEALEKMEKRRERFNHPFSQKKDLDNIVNAELMVNTKESKQQRPARKRRWGGN